MRHTPKTAKAPSFKGRGKGWLKATLKILGVIILLMIFSPVIKWFLMLSLYAFCSATGINGHSLAPWPFSYLHSGTASVAVATITPASSSASAPKPRLTVDKVNETLYSTPRSLNWEIKPNKVMCEYELDAGENGPAIYPGLNTALMEGHKMTITWPHPGWDKWTMAMQRSPGVPWEGLLEESTWRLNDSYNQIRIKGSAAEKYAPGHPLRVTVSVPENRLRTATRRPGKPSQALRWGPLPLDIDGQPIEWELHIQCAHDNEPYYSAISSKMIRERSWDVQIGASDEDVKPCTSTIFTASSHEVREEGDLIIGCPNIPGGVIMEVIVLVTKH